MKLLFLFASFVAANAQSCGDIRLDYITNNCCSGTDCSIGIPDCSATQNGKVCFDGTEVVVKGLLDAFGFEATSIILKKNLIPDTNDAYDFGSAMYKIRDIYEAD